MSTLIQTIAAATEWVAAPDAEDQWYVLHTRSRQEKAVAAHLSARGVEHFLPLVQQVRYFGRRKTRVVLPLFPNYVFLRGQAEDAYGADRQGRLVRIITVTNQADLDGELSQLRLALTHHAPLDPYPYLKTGLAAQVRTGPMQGLRGVIESRDKADRLVLRVKMLGQASALEVDASLVDVVEDGAGWGACGGWDADDGAGAGGGVGGRRSSVFAA